MMMCSKQAAWGVKFVIIFYIHVGVISLAIVTLHSQSIRGTRIMKMT